MKHTFLIICLLFLSNCREFYDEEFEADLAAQNENVRNTSYAVVLNPTDAALSELTGSAAMVVNNGIVDITFSLEGIPQNFMQIHYGYIGADCSTLSVALPNEIGQSRSYSINETISTTALNFDLRSSGAATTDQDINLAGKSLVVRAFSNLTDITSTNATNTFAIACGEISASTVPNTGTIGGTIGGTGTTVGTADGTIGGTIGGVGGATDGTIGGTTGGIGGNIGGVGGATDGTIGGTTGGIGGNIGGVGGATDGTIGGTAGGTVGF